MKNQKLIISIIGVLVIISIGLFVVKKESKTKTVDSDNKSQATTPISAQKVSPIVQKTTITTPYQFIIINPTNITFIIPKLPDVSFKITKINKATGEITTQTGCNGQASNIFLENLYFGKSGLCIRDTKIDGQDMAMVAVDIDVNNNSSSMVSGDLIQLFYTVKVDNKDVARLAQTYLPFRSYDISPFSQRSIRVGFLVPSNQNSFQLIYGYVGVDYRSGESFMGAGEGGFQLDFSKKTIIEIAG